MRKFSPAIGFAAGAAALLLACGAPARADVFQTYDLAWAGAVVHSSTAATGVMTLDLTTLPDPASGETSIRSSLKALSVTVSGALGGFGNGTFTLPDLVSGSFAAGWNTNGSTLDMTRQLVGQNVANSCGSGTTTWGTGGSCSGDFNLTFKPHGPVEAGAFTLGADGDLHQMMFLTSFAPVTAAHIVNRHRNGPPDRLAKGTPFGSGWAGSS